MALLFWKGTQPFLQLWDFSPNGNRLNWLFRLYIVHSSHVWIQVVPTVPSGTGSNEFTAHYLLSTKYGRQTQVAVAKQTQDQSTFVKDVTAQLIITAIIASAVYNVISGSVINRKSDRTLINCVSGAQLCPLMGWHLFTQMVNCRTSDRHNKWEEPSSVSLFCFSFWPKVRFIPIFRSWSRLTLLIIKIKKKFPGKQDI